MKKNKLPKFVVLDHINKAALIDPDAGVFLGVSKKILNNLETEEVQNILYPIWQKQVEIQRKIASYHEGINTLYLMITRRCNMNCAFCAINANDLTCKQYELTISDIYEKVIPFIKECKPHKFILTGGEPLIKDNIVDIVNILHEEVDTHITLQSNGIAISKKIIEELKGNIQEIDFSTKHMFGEKGNEETLRYNIEQCISAGIEVVLSFVYEKSNRNELYKVIDIAAEYNTGLLVNIIAPVGRAKEKSEFLSDIEKFHMNLDIAQYIYDKGYEKKPLCNVLSSSISVRKACGGYGKVIAIFPEGNVYMCQCLENNTYRIGNVLNDTPQKIGRTLYEKMEDITIKKAFCVELKEVCSDCMYRYFCTGKCPVSVEKENYTCYYK